MTNARSIFYGIHAVLFALFRADESLDLDAMVLQAECAIEEGCHGITVLGLATEVMKLNERERRNVIERVASIAQGRVPFSVTIVGNSVADQVSLAKFAQAAGADWLILQPPAAGNFSTTSYLDFYTRVAQAVELPVAIQNAPQLLGRAISIDDIRTLKNSCPNLAAVKFEDAAIALRNAIVSLGDDIEILGGRGGMELTDCLCAGCRGFVLAPDIAPFALRVFERWEAGDKDGAETEYQRLAPAIGFVMQSLENLICYGKRIYGTHAQIEIHDRAPALTADPFGLELVQKWAQHLREVRNG